MGVYTTVVPVFLITDYGHNPIRWCLGEEMPDDMHITYPGALTPVTVASKYSMWRSAFDMPELAGIWQEWYSSMGWTERFPKMPTTGHMLGHGMRDWRSRYTSDTNLLAALMNAQMVPMKITASVCSTCAPVGNYVLVSGHLLHSPDPEQAEAETIEYWKQAEVPQDLQHAMGHTHLMSEDFWEQHNIGLDVKIREWASAHGMSQEDVREMAAENGDEAKAIDDLTEELTEEMAYIHSQGWRMPPITEHSLGRAAERISHADSNRGTEWADWLHEAYQGYRKSLLQSRDEEDVA